MPVIIFYLAIVASIIGLLIATYTDLKQRIVPNKLNYGLAVLGLAIFAVQSYLEASPLPLTYSFFGLCFGFAFGWVLWKAGVFAGGDVKLFMGLGALNPFTPALLKIGMLTNANVPLFPITLFIYSLIAFLPYGLFVVAYKVSKNKAFQKQLYAEMKPKVILAAHTAIFASAAYVILIFLQLPVLVTIPIVLVWGFFGNKRKYVTLIAAIAAIILNLNLLIQALIAAVLFSVILYTIIKLLFSTRKVLSVEIAVKKLEEGMIPSKSLAWKGKKVVEIGGFSPNLIFKYMKDKNITALKGMFKQRKEIISARKARGLTEEEIREVKKLAAKGLIPKKMMVKESMPFVPTVLLGYLLCLIIGDFLLLIAIGGI